jgi:hypothetical protein
MKKPEHYNHQPSGWRVAGQVHTVLGGKEPLAGKVLAIEGVFGIMG